jgi:hypothetical protein
MVTIRWDGWSRLSNFLSTTKHSQHSKSALLHSILKGRPYNGIDGQWLPTPW